MFNKEFMLKQQCRDKGWILNKYIQFGLPLIFKTLAAFVLFTFTLVIPVGAQGSKPVDIDLAPNGGWWVSYENGQIEARGGAPYISSVEINNGEYLVALIPARVGYWAATNLGRVISLNGAPRLGDVSHLNLNGEVIAAVPTSTGEGFYLLGYDGGIFTFGDGRFHGSIQGILNEEYGPGKVMANDWLSAPVATMGTTKNGYWLISADGSVFSFGDAIYHGSIQDVVNKQVGTYLAARDWLDAPIIGVVPSVNGAGYLMLASDGGIFNFGKSQFHGSIAGQTTSVAIAVDVTASRSGYIIITDDNKDWELGTIDINNDVPIEEKEPKQPPTRPPRPSEPSPTLPPVTTQPPEPEQTTDHILPIVEVSNAIAGGHSFTIVITEATPAIAGSNEAQVTIEEIVISSITGESNTLKTPSKVISNDLEVGTVCLFGIKTNSNPQTCITADINGPNNLPNVLSELDEIFVIANAVIDAAGNKNIASDIFQIPDITLPKTTLFIEPNINYEFKFDVKEANLSKERKKSQVALDEIVSSVRNSGFTSPSIIIPASANTDYSLVCLLGESASDSGTCAATIDDSENSEASRSVVLLTNGETITIAPAAIIDSSGNKSLISNEITIEGLNQPALSIGIVESDACRIEGITTSSSNLTTAGFPLPQWATTTGRYDVAVLYVDFPDVPENSPTYSYGFTQFIEAFKYIEANSYGNIDVHFHSTPKWLRTSKKSTTYSNVVGTGHEAILPELLVADAVALAEADTTFDIDFSEIESVMIVLPSYHFFGGTADSSTTAHTVADEADINRASVINAILRETPGAQGTIYTYWPVLVHELIHNLGLTDLYPYDQNIHTTPDLPNDNDDKIWVMIRPGLMGLEGLFLVDKNDPRYLYNYNPIKSNPSDPDRPDNHSPLEMLAWSRWQLNWLSDSQIICMSGQQTDVTAILEPVAKPGDGVAMLAIRLRESFAIVIENRRSIGYDTNTVVVARSATTGEIVETRSVPMLPIEGIYVYAVDGQKFGGTDLPIRLATDNLFDPTSIEALFSSESKNGQLSRSPALTVGEQISWNLGDGTRLRIEVLAEEGDAFSVRVTRVNSGSNPGI